jgi:hypothetical protein
MTMPSGKFVLLILAIFCSLTINSQTLKSFSQDPAKFPAELPILFSKITSPSTGMQIRELTNPFLESWNANLFNEEEKATIIADANTLLSRKMSAFPDMYNYFAIVYNLKIKGNREALTYWTQDFLKRVPDVNQRRIHAYLAQYELLVHRNLLYQSSTFSWFISDTSFKIEYDTAIRVIYQKSDLTCATKKDTSRIFNTLGVFYPHTMEWMGKNGKVTWERVGLNPDSVYADLRDYRINMNVAEYKADTVKLFNKRYFKEPLVGQLTEKVLASPPGPLSSYPQFVSYLKNYEIHNLFKNIDYHGGFTVEGARVIGSGEVNANASLYISKEGKLRAQIRSNAFRIMGDQITANPASLSILTDGDSIYHPGLQLRYFDDKRQLVMFRSETGISQSPFFNGFHEIDMDCGSLIWNLDSDSIDFESVPSINRISINEFISNDFFSKYEFYKIQGIDDKNPLYIIRDYSRKYGTNEVTPDALADFMHKPPEQVKAMMLKLSIQGFLYYDVANDRAIIQDRLNQYIEANVGKKDYDVIRIESETNNISNATLDLNNYNLLIRGVNEVFLSDSQQVYIFPEKDEIILKKGLDFVFSGNVSAGLFDFYAHDCSFEYDSFKLNIPLIDSLSFKVKSFEKDDKGLSHLVRVASVIENLSGKLLIDNPANKSGLKSLEKYPIFYSEKESYVYYDHDPLYKRDSFAYHIYAFVLDNLDNFSTDNLQFKGYLVSAGIFPDIEQPLKVQPDYSLGFINRTPEEGYPAYGGIGQFYKEVNLSNRGLRGKGQLDFLTSLTLSEDFHFYPEMMITSVAGHFTIDPQIASVEYPKVVADSIYQDWYPYRDAMHLQSLMLPIRMFDEKALLNGDLYYSSTGLSGRGKVGFESVELASEKYIFRHHTIDADALDFKLFAKGTNDLAVSAEKYRTHVDFDTRTVEFRTNEKGSTVSFPYNNFLCYMDNIDWYMDQHEMKLYNDLGEKYANIDNMSREELLKLDLSGSDFVATNPQADSLSFFSVTARYDLDNYIIDAEDVKLVRVADAAIFPDSNYIKISKGGQIQILKNAGIIADTANRFHTIEQAEVSILSRKNFQAKGIYQYHDTSNVVQEVPLSLISVDSTGRTFARGVINDKLKFSLNPHFAFKGKMSLTSVRKELFFEGGFQTRDDCFRVVQKYWVAFNSWVDPDNVRIPVEPPLADLDGDPIDLAIQISDYEEEIYSSWFSPRALQEDTALVSPSGEIYYDEKADGYRISKPGKASPDQFQSRFLYDTRNCTVEASGPLSLGLSFNYVNMTNFGDIRYLIIPDSTTLNVTLTFNFLFYDGCLSVMADSLDKADLKGLDVTRKDYMDYLDYTLGSDSKDLKEDISNYGKIRRLPDKLIHEIVLTDVNLYWNSYTNSYISKGQIGVSSLGKDPVNRYVNGYLELIRRRSGDIISLYLEVSPIQYYFFDYRNGIMQAISSDNEFNNRINETKQEKRVASIPGLDETYEFMVAPPRKHLEFIRKMQQLMN